MGFIKKTPPPPECEEGDILKAKLTEVKTVKSQWKDQEGNLREQLQIDFELENNYKGRAWIAFYENPGDKSALGKLALKLQQVTKREFTDIQEFLTAFKSFGQVFVSVKGFREYEGETYPNFSIVTDKLPSMQEKLSVSKKEPEPKAKATEERTMKTILESFKDVISLGVPLSLNDLGNSVTVADRLTLFKEGLIEQKEGLYFFTDKAKELSNAV